MPGDPGYPDCPPGVIKCPAGYRDGPAGVTNINLCVQNCKSTQTTNGINVATTASVFYANTCNTTLVCYEGYKNVGGSCVQCDAGEICIGPDPTCVATSPNYPDCLCENGGSNYPACDTPSCVPGNPSYPKCLTCPPSNPTYPLCTTPELCPNGGTSAPGSYKVSQCYKLSYCPDPIVGPGQQTCFYTSGTGTAAVYGTNCSQCLICTGDYHISPDGTTCDPNTKQCMDPITGKTGYMSWLGTGWSDCKVMQCPYNQELISGVCKDCNRANALTYKLSGNCIVDSCKDGYHPNGTQCDPDVISCTLTNAVTATRTWANGTYGVCTPIVCQTGYHISANACVKSTQTCTIANGIGAQEWVGDALTGSWGPCTATSCNPGWTLDKTLTDEQSTVIAGGCGACRNKFGVFGEVAAGTYTSECDIAACLYQGELYNLDNNECVPICDPNGRTDETGTMTWDKVNHKCIRSCNTAAGYMPW